MKKNKIAVDEAILALKEKLDAQPRREGGRLARVSTELRSEALALWPRSGLTRPDFSKQLGINPTSMYNWKKWQPKKNCRTKGRWKRSAAETTAKTPRKSKFKRLVVGPAAEQRDVVASAATSSKLLALELGSGARVTGLSLADVARLIGLGAK